MTEEGATYADALAEAQSLGYAERDPTADVEGYDAGAKAAIIATHRLRAAGRRRRRLPRGHHRHHRRPTSPSPAASATSSSCSPSPSGSTTAARSACGCTRRWCPTTTRWPRCASSFNAVFVEGDAVGDLMFYGRGAGGDPTASAVLGDLIDAAVNLRKGTHATVGTLGQAPHPARSTSSQSEYYLNLEVVDRPGVLRRGGRRVRRPRRVDPLDGAGGPRRRGPPHLHHPRGRARPTCRPTLHDLRELDVGRTASAACCASSARAPTRR